MTTTPATPDVLTAPVAPAAKPATEKHDLRCPRCGSGSVKTSRTTMNATYSGQPAKDAYDYVKRHEYYCTECYLVESCTDDQPEFVAKRGRWRNPIFVDTYSHEDYARQLRETIERREANEKKRTWPQDPVSAGVPFYRELLADRGDRAVPEHPELFAQILADPEDDTLRRKYATWMNTQAPARWRTRESVARGAPEWHESPSNPADVAWFIEAQLNTHDALRADPKAALAPFWLRDGYQFDPDEMRLPFVAEYGTHELSVTDDFTEQRFFVRGFIEHVAIKARAFLDFAAFLYELAPLRHLTLTYCPPVLGELLASPHLDRIRTLILPNRMLRNEHTRLNALTDDHVAALALSPHLGRVNFLDLEDNEALTIRALDHLALSPHLRALSYVGADVYGYSRAYGSMGDYRQTLYQRRVDTWRDELEARHGYLPWLHPEDHYGTPTPLFEAVTAHPVGDDTFRPDLAARRRARLPAEVDLALSNCLYPDGSLRERTLRVSLPTGPLLATLERAAPDPDLPELRALVTLTVDDGAPLPAYDVATRANVTLRPRTTATVGARIPRPR
jgi:hypothetical protein